MTNVTPLRPARAPAPRRPRSWAPRGLRLEDAAYHYGVSPNKFLDWVARGLMPEPKRERGVTIWDREACDAAFDAIGETESACGPRNSFDDD